ncbi:MAG TPA: hypothetical protein VFQ36_04380 [Ktedonobacteraceae bacterium]|nr:hypothetical protein [Ktedonobacteraceae bacterium]
MSGHRPWSEISEKVRADPERRARIEQREQAIAADLTISQLREARGMNIADPGPGRNSSSPGPTQHG